MTDKEIGKIAFNKFGLQECDEDYTYFVLGYKEAIKKQFAITDVVSTCCDKVPSDSYYLGTTCLKCNKPFRQINK